MSSAPIKSIVICGAGLASWMTAAALSKNLPSGLEITVLETPNSTELDVFYGFNTNPNAYNFHLSLGLTEADLLMRTQSAFSYGTLYEKWGLTDASWVQCFHAPFPIWSGVQFTHHVTSEEKELELYLVSAQAAAAGKFAHPPADKKIALSSAEYGYHFNPEELTALLKKIAKKNGVKTIKQKVMAVEVINGHIKNLKLGDGTPLKADLYVDASGPNAQLFSTFDACGFDASRTLGVLYSKQNASQLGPPVRRVTSGTFGWQSVTPLQGTTLCMTVFDPKSENEARQSHAFETVQHSEITTGQRHRAWTGNCVALGHASAVIEPISPAPLMQLQLDIQRLIGLIPVASDYAVERRIFNDAFQSDLENALLFNDTFFQIESPANAPYWTAARQKSLSPKLERKIKQFTHRGLLVSYDLELFNEEDWAILHYGMGRKPEQKNIFSVLTDTSKVGQDLENMSQSIKDIVNKMPPHHTYMANYINYLERNYVSEL